MDSVYKLEIMTPDKRELHLQNFSSLNKVKHAIDEFCREIDMVVIWNWKKVNLISHTEREIKLLKGEIYTVDEELCLYEIFCTKLIVE